MDPEVVEHLEKTFNRQSTQTKKSDLKPKFTQTTPAYAVKVFSNMKVSEGLKAKSGVSMYKASEPGSQTNIQGES